MNVVDFASLGLVEPVLSAVRGEGYETPTPIQSESIPALLAGRDLLGIAQTGTGKTAAFALPLIQRLLADPKRAPHKSARVLVVAPTRELAAQIADSFAAYGRGANLSRACVFGGVGSVPQEKALLKGVDVLVATPGRLLDLIDRGHLTLSTVESVVLDEADRMFDMGFIRDVRRIVALLPKKRQTIFFSATMPPEIEAFADPLLVDPVRAAVPSAQPTADRIEQKVLFVSKEDKRRLLTAILKEDEFKRVIVFTKTKHGANRLVKQLAVEGIAADAIHANKSQNARIRTMDAFRNGGVDVLVATDLAARGIDVDDIELVVNFDLPNESETYVHRIGRTARAGAEGVAVSFCDAEERPLLRDIERLIGFRIPVELDHPYRLDIEPLRDQNGGAARRSRPGFGAGGGAGSREERNNGERRRTNQDGRRRDGSSRAGIQSPVQQSPRHHSAGHPQAGFQSGGRQSMGSARRKERGGTGRGGYGSAAGYGQEPSLADLFSGAASFGVRGGQAPTQERNPAGRGTRSNGPRPRHGEGGERRSSRSPLTDNAEGMRKTVPADQSNQDGGNGGRRRRRRGGRGRGARPDQAPSGTE